MTTKTIKTAEDMIKLGEKLAKEDRVLLLEGHPNSGKTSLVKGFAKGLGLNPDEVDQRIINIYGEKLLHLDMMMIHNVHQLLRKNILDLINKYEYIAIEHPHLLDILGLSGKKITIEGEGDGERKVTIEEYENTNVQDIKNIHTLRSLRAQKGK